MSEALLVLGTVGALVAIGLLGPLLPSSAWLLGGAVCAALGLAVGVPTGFVYHLRLRACLRARGALPAHWWLRPTSLHVRLREDERPGVLGWFLAGGAGFLLTLLGCAAVVAGVALDALGR